jgi:hypothetical protein
MRRALLSAVAAGLAAAAMLVTGIAAAAVSPTYTVTGIGSAANPTETTLIGTGAGSAGDRLTWTANLQYTAPGTGVGTITGGTLTALAHGGGMSLLGGVFTGGSLTFDAARSSRATCGDLVYDVQGDLEFDGWTGTFTAYLTQNRIRLLNRCLTLTATVTGAPGLTLTPVTTAPASPPPPPSAPPPGEL